MKTTFYPRFSASLTGRVLLGILMLTVCLYNASASLTLGLRATQISTNGGTTFTDLTGVSGGIASFGGGVTSLNVSAGEQVVFTLFADVSGTTAEPNPDPTGTTNFQQGFQNAFGYVTQAGSTFGTWKFNTNNGDALSPGGLDYLGAPGVGVFAGNGAQGGKIQDLNADGHQDIGSTSTSPSDTNQIFIRANQMIGGTRNPQQNGGVTPTFSPDRKTSEIFVGNLTLTISSLGTSETVQWNLPIGGFAGTPALWKENNVSQSVAAGGTLIAGSAVTLTAVPEPGTWAMLILGGTGLIFFRRRGLGWNKTL